MGDNGEGLLISSGVAELILVKPELSLKIQSSPHLKLRTIYFSSIGGSKLEGLNFAYVTVYYTLRHRAGDVM